MRRLNAGTINPLNIGLIGVGPQDNVEVGDDGKPDENRISYGFQDLKREYDDGLGELTRLDAIRKISNDMNLIEEGLRNPREFLNLLDDIINGREKLVMYFGMKIVSLVIGKKGFDVEKVCNFVPLIKVIE